MVVCQLGLSPYLLSFLTVVLPWMWVAPVVSCTSPWSLIIQLRLPPEVKLSVVPGKFTTHQNMIVLNPFWHTPSRLSRRATCRISLLRSKQDKTLGIKPKHQAKLLSSSGCQIINWQGLTLHWTTIQRERSQLFIRFLSHKPSLRLRSFF